MKLIKHKFSYLNIHIIHRIYNNLIFIKMRKVLILAIVNLVFIISSYAQQNKDSLDVRVNVLIDKTKNKTINEEEKSELIGYVFQIQNKGFKLEERKRDYANSLIEINKALVIWTAIGDTASIANLLKFRGGLLYGRLKEFEKGKIDLNNAITLFKKIKMVGGDAVSYHDYSILYDHESKIDSALYYENRALDIWKELNDPFRIIVSNNQLIHLYQKQKKFEKAAQIQKETDLILNQSKVVENPMFDFYYVSFELYTVMKNDSLAKKYKDLYLAKLEALKKEGIIEKSMYEL